MSASQKKRKRQVGVDVNSKKSLAEREAEEKKRKKKIEGTIYGVLIALLIVFVVVVNSGILYRTVPAVSVGGENYTAAEFNYLYYSSYYSMINSYGEEMVKMMGLDPSQPLKSQEYPNQEAGFANWAEYFEDAALKNLQNITMLCNQAEAEGYTLTEKDKESLQASIESFETAYAQSGFKSKGSFLSANYGKGASEKMVNKLIEKSILASSYSAHKAESFTYDEQAKEDYYNENKDEYDLFDYYFYTVAAETDTTEYEEGSQPSPEEAEAKKAEFMAAAKEKADSIAAQAETDGFYNAVYEALPDDSKASYPDEESLLRKGAAGSSLDESYAAWLKDESRTEGDITVAETGTGYAVLCYVGRNDNHYNTKNVRHILVKIDEPTQEPVETPALGEEIDQQEDAEAEAAAEAELEKRREEAAEAARTEIEEIYQEWKNGEATEESFAELVSKYSEDEGSVENGGLYENIYEGQMVPEFNAFCFNPDRKPGDTEIVYGESAGYKGYHIIYFVGDGPLYSSVKAEEAMRTNDYTEWETAEIEKNPITLKSMMRLTK